MFLTHEEVQQLKAVGFDDTQIAEVQLAKTGAVGSAMNWLDLFQKLIANGPQIIAFLKLFGGLFSNVSAPAATDSPTIPPK